MEYKWNGMEYALEWNGVHSGMEWSMRWNGVKIELNLLRFLSHHEDQAKVIRAQSNIKQLIHVHKEQSVLEGLFSSHTLTPSIARGRGRALWTDRGSYCHLLSTIC